MNGDVPQLSISVPVSVPTPERMEEIYREVCAEVAMARATWFDFAGAAEYLQMSLRTFERRKAAWGLPVCELSAGTAAAAAVTVTLQWEAPSPLPEGLSITSYQLRIVDANGAVLRMVEVPAPQTQASFSDLLPGNGYAFNCIAIDNQGVASLPSNTVNWTAPLPTPTPTPTPSPSPSATPLPTAPPPGALHILDSHIEKPATPAPAKPSPTAARKR